MGAVVPLLGGPAAYTSLLDKFFNKSTGDTSNLLPNPYYWAGNEEDVRAGCAWHIVAVRRIALNPLLSCTRRTASSTVVALT